MQYSMSNNPLGPFTPCGAYMYPHGEETAHGSIVEYKGRWYSFYHTAKEHCVRFVSIRSSMIRIIN
jgi:hypothetical protein